MTNIANKKNLSSKALKLFSYSVYDEYIIGKNDSHTPRKMLHGNFSPAFFNIPNDVFSFNEDKIPDVITIPQILENADEHAFSGCEFNYVYQIKDSEERVFSKYNIDIANIKCTTSIEELQKTLPGLTCEKLVRITDLGELITFAKKMNATKTIIPFDFYCKLKEEDCVEHFTRKMYFKFFNKELASYLQELSNENFKEQTAFFLFALSLGCFAKEYIVTLSDEQTNSLLCHKASNLLARLIQTKTLKFGDFDRLFGKLPINIIPNQNFYFFLSSQNGKNNFVNAKLLVKNSIYNRDYFSKIMQNFDRAHAFKITLNAMGQPVELSWETALNRFYNAKAYKNITKDNNVIAKIYGSRGIEQKTFSEACDVFDKAKKLSIPHHILGKPLKEKNDGTKMFTYEFLDKHNPKNGILGLYCSCCATLASDYYGKDIATAGIISPNVQNVIIRDRHDTIIGKGTMYLNRKNGYAVFNDFEIEYKYRVDNVYVWQDEELTAKAKLNVAKRQEILKTFMRAINDFKTEYDKQNPSKPLRRVAVGVGMNKLKDVCEENFERMKNVLKVPKKYGFKDAETHQFLLLGKNNTHTKIESKTNKEEASLQR